MKIIVDSFEVVVTALGVLMSGYGYVLVLTSKVTVYEYKRKKSILEPYSYTTFIPHEIAKTGLYVITTDTIYLRKHGLVDNDNDMYCR
jgi:hypothetical protein